LTAHDVRDLTIIGAGPAGLFGTFYAGMRGISVRLVDALPELGGQLTALYPEKYIFDVAGFPKVLAKDLVKGLVQQAMQFNASAHLAQEVTGLVREQEGGRVVFGLQTPDGEYWSRAILITAGIGAFQPRKLPLDDYDHWVGRGLFDKVLSPVAFEDQRVLIVGGGDSACDWVLNLQGVASSVTLVHRRDAFRAHQATLDQVHALAAAGKVSLRTFQEVKAIHGDERVRSVTLLNTKTKGEERVEVDALIALLGFISRLGAIANWGLALENDSIVVNQRMETNEAGIYAAGDVVTYPGKLKLIATGFGEACTAVNLAVHFIYPDRKTFPGHSSNMAMFGGTP
jgi:thioredoxin reductase (NADPH)